VQTLENHLKTSLCQLGLLLSVALVGRLSSSLALRGAAGVSGVADASRPPACADLYQGRDVGSEVAPACGLAALCLVGRPAPINISESPADSRFPALAVSADQIHVVWEENGRVQHRFRDQSGWSVVRSVATGEQPAIAMDAAGMLHLILVNEFGDNYEVYHCRWNGTAWTLPRNVSNTSGVSSAPSLAIAADGTLHVVWADNTPGYSVIYHAWWDGRYWINAPIPNALGGAPAVAVSPDGTVHVVWQDRDTPASPYDIYHSQQSLDTWTLPENLSDTQTEPSTVPDVSAGSSDRVHVVWQEKIGGHYTVCYTAGHSGSWSQPESVSTTQSDAYLPCVSAGTEEVLYSGWDDGTSILCRRRLPTGFDGSPVTVVASDPSGMSDVRLALDPDMKLHAVWVQHAAGGNRDVFYARLAYDTFFPAVFEGGRF
jgi:hypothetical protein